MQQKIVLGIVVAIVLLGIVYVGLNATGEAAKKKGGTVTGSGNIQTGNTGGQNPQVRPGAGGPIVVPNAVTTDNEPNMPPNIGANSCEFTCKCQKCTDAMLQCKHKTGTLYIPFMPSCMVCRPDPPKEIKVAVPCPATGVVPEPDCYQACVDDLKNDPNVKDAKIPVAPAGEDSACFKEAGVECAVLYPNENPPASIPTPPQAKTRIVVSGSKK